MSYTKLATSVLTSTIWMESDHTRIVWFTLLALSDKNGEVQASIPGLANIARVPVDSCREAIALFLSPDPDSRTKDDDGRRIEAIQGGWFLVNHSQYRNLSSDEDRKQKAAERQQRFRDKAARNAIVTPDSTSREQRADTKADSFLTEKIIVEKRKKREGALECPEFIAFYKLYPHKKSKAHAERMWVANNCSNNSTRILQALSKQLPEILSREPRFRPHPGTWLNERRWEDETDAPVISITAIPEVRKKTKMDFIKAWETAHNQDYMNYPHDENNKPIPAFILGESDYKAYLAKQNGH